MLRNSDGRQQVEFFFSINNIEERYQEETKKRTKHILSVLCF